MIEALISMEREVSLAPYTTLELGGPARGLVTLDDREALSTTLAWAKDEGWPVLVLGEGSNVVVGDDGFAGLVIRWRPLGVEFDKASGRVRAQAGESWDAFVETTVSKNWAGLECLSGIPGLVGATPVQNVGAYGQEVANTLVQVEVMDRRSGMIHHWNRDECQFRYRGSRFKDEPESWIVLSVEFQLMPDVVPQVRYSELSRSLDGSRLSLGRVREEVLRIRSQKSMVLNSQDPNRRSVGSFFTNPIVPNNTAEKLLDRAVLEGVVKQVKDVPCFPVDSQRSKLSAAWLIERSGFHKGLAAGRVGISTRHTLALVHLGGGQTAELLALARNIQRGVHDVWGVHITPEPLLVNCSLKNN